jgi:hypothetical protein
MIKVLAAVTTQTPVIGGAEVGDEQTKNVLKIQNK